MAFYSYVFTANYKRFFNSLKEVSKKEKKSFILMTIDTVYCTFRYGFGLTDYLNFQIYKRTRKERKEYVGARMENVFYEQVSPSAYKKRYTIKPDFLADFKKYTKRDFIVPNSDNYEEFEHFINSHSSFMSKPYDGLRRTRCKKGIFKRYKR